MIQTTSMTSTPSLIGVKRTRSILKQTHERQEEDTPTINSKRSRQPKRSVCFGPSTQILFDKKLPACTVRCQPSLSKPLKPASTSRRYDRWSASSSLSVSGCSNMSLSMPRQPRRQ
jgi:hypothetical protein